jgi:ribosome biogenesis GTPase / thiamine phosphate phosphatase
MRGMVLEVHLRRYRVRTAEGKDIIATLAKELRRDGAVVGDQVALTGDVSGETGSLARIVAIEPRKTLLRRSAQDGDELEQAVVANADQLVIVVAAANPEPRSRLVDRYLVAAYQAGLKPILCVTKCDLADPTEFLANFAGFGLTVVKTRTDSFDLTALAAMLDGHSSVFVGHSGVGKSTLVNALAPNSNRSTGVVNTVTGRGRHTSSSAVAIEIAGGWLIDTPGVRTFGLAGVTEAGLLAGFADLSTASENCPRDCAHTAIAPDCALDAALANGEVAEIRLDSFRRLLETLTAPDSSN